MVIGPGGGGGMPELCGAHAVVCRNFVVIREGMPELCGDRAGGGGYAGTLWCSRGGMPELCGDQGGYAGTLW